MKLQFKRTIALICSAAMLISSAACSGVQTAAPGTSDNAAAATTTTAAEAETTTTTTAAPEPAETTFLPDSSNVKLIGRTLTENDTLWIAQSASGIEFTCTGTHASVDIKGDGAALGAADSRARFAIYVDGKRVLDEMVDSAEKTYDIFDYDTEKEATVKILKLSESTNSTFGITGITVTGEGDVAPTPEKELKIEFIGDSITCAYGVDDEVKEHHFSTETEDATKSFAYKTAEALDADYSMVSYSGHGVVSGYTSKEKNTDNLVPPVYEQFAKTYGSSSGYFTETTPWDFSEFVPQYIVINLGTNDYSYTGGKKEKKAEFVEEYVKFLKMVRKDNPDAFIICSLGIMGANLYSQIEKAVNQYIEETGDTNLAPFYFDQQNGDKNGIAADWHPTEGSHQDAADALVEYFNTLINGSTQTEETAISADETSADTTVLSEEIPEISTTEEITTTTTTTTEATTTATSQIKETQPVVTTTPIVASSAPVTTNVYLKLYDKYIDVELNAMGRGSTKFIDKDGYTVTVIVSEDGVFVKDGRPLGVPKINQDENHQVTTKAE